MVVAEALDREEMGSCLMSPDFQFCKMKKIWRLVAQQCIFNITELYT